MSPELAYTDEVERSCICPLVGLDREMQIDAAHQYPRSELLH